MLGFLWLSSLFPSLRECCLPCLFSMRFLRPLFLTIPLLSTALANVEFTDPAVGSTFKGGGAITAHWKDSDELPRISDLSRYDIYLCAGGNIAGSYEELAAPIKDAPFARGNSISFKIDPAVGGEDGVNAYFLKMVAAGPDAPVISFSNRFSLTNMTGSFSPRVTDGIHSVQDAHGSLDGLQKRQAVGKHTIPYALQTGATRYAPMAKRPGTTIPPGKPTPQNPTSSYSIATTYLGSPLVESTKSASLTDSVSSIENTASPAPHPHDTNVKRWLERWKE